MDRYPSPLRWCLAASVLVALVATGCTRNGGNDIDDLRRELEDNGDDNAAARVEPPPAADPSLTARVGLILATNSRSFGRIMDAAGDAGVVVLFSQPGGPAEDAGLERGHVITAVDGEASTNAERGVVQLRSRPGQERTLSVVRPDGSRDEVTVDAEVPGPVDLRELYGPMIEQDPDDPILRFLRAQTPGTFEEVKADVDHAVEVAPGFVEAISLRAEHLWNRARQVEDTAQVEQLRDAAMTDRNLALRLDPLNTRVLVSRAQALAQVGNAASAKRDAEKARTSDPGFPGAHYAHALADFRLGQHQQAAAPVRRAIDLNPYDVRYYELLGAVFVRLEEREKCTATIEAIIDLVDQPAARERMLRICGA